MIKRKLSYSKLMYLLVAISLSFFAFGVAFLSCLSTNSNTHESTEAAITYWPDYAADSFAGGNGTASSPYLIETAAQLARLAKLINNKDTTAAWNSKYYKQTANIDLSTGGRIWTPIGNSSFDEVAENNHTVLKNATVPFKGTYDGDGHVVSGIKNSLLSTTGGLFGSGRGCTIKNVGVLDPQRIYGIYGAGSILGAALMLNDSGSSLNDACYVLNCFSAGGTYIGGAKYGAGGIMGYAFAGGIENCYNASSGLVSSSATGGLMGYALWGYAECSFNIGGLSTSSDYPQGGIFGASSVLSSATSVFSVGKRNTSKYAGVSGNSLEGTTPSCSKVFHTAIVDYNEWDMSADPPAITSGGTLSGVSRPSNLATQAKNWSWFSTNIDAGNNNYKLNSTIIENDGYPVLSVFCKDVTANANGGSVVSSNGWPAGSTSKKTMVNGYLNMPTATRTGYTFDGWYTAASGGTKVEPTWANMKESIPSNIYAHWSRNSYSISTDLRGGTTYKNIITPSTICDSWTASTSYANYMTLKYDAPSGIYTMTNTAAGNDPYATGNQTVYLDAGKTYVMHAICTDNSGVSVTGNPLQIFYGINRAYSETNSKRFGETTTQEFTVSTSGTYNFRFDNDYSYASGGVMKVHEFWVAEKTQSTATQYYPVPYQGYYPVANPTKEGYAFAGWQELLNTTTSIIISASASDNYNYRAMLTGVVPGVKYEIKIGTAKLTSGSASQVTTLIYDFTTSKTLASATNQFGTNVSYTLTCPSSAVASDNIQIIIYAGINGATANNAASYSGIEIFSSHTLGSYSALSNTSTSRKVYYAQYLPAAYKVTFNPNGGTITSGNATDYVTYGATYAGKTNIYRPVFNSLALTSSGNILSVNTDNSSGSRTSFANFMTSYDGATVQPSTTYTVVIKVTAFSGNTFTLNFTSPYDVGSTGLGDTTTATCGLSITGTGLYVKTFTTKSNLNGSYCNFRSYIPVSAGKKAIATFQVALYVGQFNTNPTNSTFEYHQEAAGNTLPVPTRTGYSFAGWYTAQTGGTKVSADTIVSNASNHTLYAHWTINSYDLNLVPNGGYYESSSANRTYSGDYGSTQYFGKPLRTGYTFEGYTLTGAGTLSERKASSGFNSATLKSDANGAYYNYVFSGTRPSENNWPNIQYPTYTFTAGKTYVLNLKIRVNSTTDGFSIRHASMSNDWVCPVKTFSGATNGWVDVTLEQTIGENYTRSGTSYTSSPRLEIYMGSTKATGSNGTTYKVDFDIKNIVVYEKESGQTAFSSIAYTYGAGTGTMTAKWQVKNYSVTINPNGGTYGGSTAAKSVSGNYGTTTTISDPTRTGYTFAGWVATKTDLSTTWAQILYHDAVYGTNLFASGDNLASNVVNSTTKNSQFATLAKLNLTSYEFLLEYHHTLQAGSSMYPRQYNRWKQTSNPATTNNAISGYQAVAISWTDSAWGGIGKSSTTDSTFIDGSPGTGTWFYALGAYKAWNGGIPGPSSAEKNIVTLYLATDSTLSNFKPTASFKDADALGSNNTYYFKDESVTLRALWIVNNYTLTANANGGSIPSTSGWSGTGAKATKSVAYNTAYGTLPTPTKTGYGFAGWWTAASGGTQVNSNTKMGSSNATIYAHWTINAYTLTANCNGGAAPSTLPTGWTANGTSPYRSLNYNTIYDILPEPTRQGYIFAGWWTQASGGSEVGLNTRMGASDTTIYAHWVESWVKYMSNGNPVMDQTDGYYIIDSAEKLARLAYLVNYNIDGGKWAEYQYKQTANIDLSAHYWQPIGVSAHSFGGIFDGKTFDINNLTFKMTNSNVYNSDSDIGLFGFADAGTINNVNVYNCNINAGQRVGGIVGYSLDTYSQNCRVSGSVQAATYYGDFGGIAGFITGGSEVRECENNAQVDSGSGSNAGGIVGNACSGSRIIDCINIGNISGGDQIGGIIGNAESITITGCVNNGHVYSNYDVGGIAGYGINFEISKCVNTGVVEGVGRVGGATSCSEGTLTVEYFVNTGKLVNDNGEDGCGIGGVLGLADGTATITSSFADCDISSRSTNLVGAFIGVDGVGATIKYCGARINVNTAISNLSPFVSTSGICNDSYSLINNGGTQVNRITATSSGMDGKFGMISSIHDGLPIPLGIYHISQYGTTTGIASTLKGSKYGCTNA